MVSVLCNPFPYVLLVIILLWTKFYKPGKRALFFRTVISILVFYVFSTPFLITPLLERLENTYEPLDLSSLDTAQQYHILILGAGRLYNNRLPANANLNPQTLMRLVEGVRIKKYLPNAKLITSARSRYGFTPQAQLAKEAAIMMGIDSSFVYIQDQPYSTETEAKEYVKLFSTHTSLIVVTSAFHMPRTVKLLQKNGVEKIIPAPTAYIVERDRPYSWDMYFPNLKFFAIWQITVKEYIGLLLS